MFDYLSIDLNVCCSKNLNEGIREMYSIRRICWVIKEIIENNRLSIYICLDKRIIKEESCMGVFSENVIDLKGIKLHVIPTKKYKTNTIVFKMKSPLNKENVTKRALLPHVLQSNSKQFPTTAKLRSYLDELYGATILCGFRQKKENTMSLASRLRLQMKNFYLIQRHYWKRHLNF